LGHFSPLPRPHLLPSSPSFPLQFQYLHSWEWVLKSPTVIAEVFISLFNSVSVCFVYLNGLSLRVCMPITGVLFCHIEPFINI
jgi:hypothetical protein